MQRHERCTPSRQEEVGERGRRSWSGSRKVAQGLGQFAAMRKAQLLISAVEPVLDGSHREMHCLGDLLVGISCGRLQGGVEFGRGQLGSGSYGPDEGGDRALTVR